MTIPSVHVLIAFRLLGHTVACNFAFISNNLGHVLRQYLRKRTEYPTWSYLWTKDQKLLQNFRENNQGCRCEILVRIIHVACSMEGDGCTERRFLLVIVILLIFNRNWNTAYNCFEKGRWIKMVSARRLCYGVCDLLDISTAWIEWGATWPWVRTSKKVKNHCLVYWVPGRWEMDTNVNAVGNRTRELPTRQRTLYPFGQRNGLW